MLVALAGVLFVFDDLLATCCGQLLQAPATVLLLACAYIINAITQLLSSDLQGRGQARTLVIFSVIMLLLSYPAFTLAARELGMLGIAIAWLGRASIELLFYGLVERRSRPAEDSPDPLAKG